MIKTLLLRTVLGIAVVAITTAFALAIPRWARVDGRRTAPVHAKP